MDTTVRFDEPLPDNVLAEMRAMYTGPVTEAYWTAMEARIMTALPTPLPARARHTWWQTHAGWTQASLVAAAVILLAIGALVMRSRTREMQAAHNALSKPTPTESLSVPTGALGEREGSDARDATLRDAIRH